MKHLVDQREHGMQNVMITACCILASRAPARDIKPVSTAAKSPKNPNGTFFLLDEELRTATEAGLQVPGYLVRQRRRLKWVSHNLLIAQLKNKPAL